MFSSKRCNRSTRLNRGLWAGFASILAIIAISLRSFAQVGNARLRGTVEDQQGRVVPNAMVMLTNEQTGTSTTVKTTATGDYTIPEVPLGTYTLQVTAPRFQVFQQRGVTLTADQQLTVPVELLVGSATQTVTVSGAGSLVDTQTGTIKTIIDQKSMRDLPLASRDVRQLIALTQCVIAVGPTFNSAIQSSTLPGTPDYTFNGGRENTVNYVLDGVDNNDPYTNVPAPYPDLDALSEFSVQTSNFDAEYGRNSGGIVNAITKSGTNRLYGSAYEFLRDGTLGLGANDWGINQYTPHAERPFLLQHQFGRSLGGPVYIPHVYDGRNKSFWFVSNQQTIIHTRDGVVNLTIPTPAQRGATSANGCNGADRSYFLPSNAASHPQDSRSFVVTDPQTGQPFPNNCIPASMLDRAATQFLNTYNLESKYDLDHSTIRTLPSGQRWFSPSR